MDTNLRSDIDLIRKYREISGHAEIEIAIDDEMRKNVVDKVLGKNYDAYIMFDDSAPKGEYDKMHSKYAKDVSKWEQIWRSASGQSEARLSPDKKVVKATIFGKGGIIGAIYVKK